VGHAPPHAITSIYTRNYTTSADANARGLAGWREAFDDLPNDGAKVAAFERAWRANPEWFEPEREGWARWLFDVAETYHGENNAIWAHAGRMWEEIAPC
jgi:hypothetical protein